MNEEKENGATQSESTEPQLAFVKGPDDLSRTDVKGIYNAAGIGLDFASDANTPAEKKLEWCMQVFSDMQTVLEASVSEPLNKRNPFSSFGCLRWGIGTQAYADCIKNHPGI